MNNVKNFFRLAISEFPNIDWGEAFSNKELLVLKWGENPYSPPLAIQEDIKESLSGLNRYPNQMDQLLQSLAQYTGLRTENICLTNGADKAFRLLAETCIEAGNEVLSFFPSYPVIESAVELMGGKMIKLPLTSKFLLPPITKIKSHCTSKTKALYLCNPNNPTGNLIATSQQIEELLQLNILIIVDEAYYEFSQKTVVPLLAKYRNLIILRSFSKGFGLAGLRVGYILASAELLAGFKKVEQTIEIFNIATPSLVGAISTLQNKKLFEENWEKIYQTKAKMKLELNKLDILTHESLTSFMLLDLKLVGITAVDFCQKMLAKNILLKNCDIYQGLDKWKVYTAIPAEKDLPRFFAAVKEIVKKREN